MSAFCLPLVQPMTTKCNVVTSAKLTSTADRYQLSLLYAMVTCEKKLFQNYFSIRRRPSEIILFQCVETCLKLFQNYFRGLLQLMNIFQHVQCR